MPKRKPNLVTILIIFVVGILVFQSGLLKIWSPRSVQLSLAPNGSPIHVADTWQEWTITKNDGSQLMKSSAFVGISLSLELIDLSIIRSIEINVKAKLTSMLPSGNVGGFNYWTYVVMRPAVSVAIDGSYVATADPNWFGARAFMAGDPVGSSLTYPFWVLLSGEMQSQSSRTIDLRSEVATKVAAGSTKFNFKVSVSEVWDAYRTWQSATMGTTQTDHEIIPVAYTLDFGTDLALATAPTTWTPWVPTASVSTCQDGICVELIPTTVTQTALGGWATVTIRENATTLVLETSVTTLEVPTLENPCSWVPWLCGKTLGIDNWLLILAAILILLILYYAPRRSDQPTR